MHESGLIFDPNDIDHKCNIPAKIQSFDNVSTKQPSLQDKQIV